LRVLLAEDDRLLGDGIRAGLSQDGYTVDWVSDGRAAAQALQTDQFDLVVLDLGLPHRSGLDVLRELRARGDATPVLILTARDAVPDRVAGLDGGADDYLTKPFDLEELSARLRALQRRSKGRATPLIEHGTLTLDPAARRVWLEGQEVELSPVEFTLLRLLLDEEGRVVRRDRIEEALYGWVREVESNAIEVHVHHLRKKLGASLIRTVRGIGYTVDAPP
jgi:two-component system response regulator QseB